MAADLYAMLGLNKGASASEIKKAYRKLARDLHPDRNPGDKEAEEHFKQVSQAYQVLGDAKKRKLYDEFGDVGLKEGFDPEAFRQYQAWQQAGGGASPGGATFDFGEGLGGRGGFTFNLDDLLGGAGAAGGMEDIFGGRAGRRRRAPARGPDLESSVTIGFLEALTGAEKELAFQVPGAAEGHRSFTVRIPAGVKDGDKVRLRGQGGAARGGGAPGDLILTVQVRNHPWFWREDDDLHVNLPVTPKEAFHGAKVKVPTIGGDVTVTVPPHTQSGAVLRLRGKGAPKRGKGHGDLLAHVQIRLPEEKTADVNQALEKLDEAFAESPRASLHL